jgi:hypothetical protein
LTPDQFFELRNELAETTGKNSEEIVMLKRSIEQKEAELKKAKSELFKSKLPFAPTDTRTLTLELLRAPLTLTSGDDFSSLEMLPKNICSLCGKSYLRSPFQLENVCPECRGKRQSAVG